MADEIVTVRKVSNGYLIVEPDDAMSVHDDIAQTMDRLRQIMEPELDGLVTIVAMP